MRLPLRVYKTLFIRAGLPQINLRKLNVYAYFSAFTVLLLMTLYLNVKLILTAASVFEVLCNSCHDITCPLLGALATTSCC